MDVSNELADFTGFVQAQVAQGVAAESLDQLYDEWRRQRPHDAQHAENVAAVAASLEDFRRGERGAPAGALSRDLRAKLGARHP